VAQQRSPNNTAERARASVHKGGPGPGCDTCGISPLVGDALGGSVTLKDPVSTERRYGLCEECMRIALRGQLYGDRSGLRLLRRLGDHKRAWCEVMQPPSTRGPLEEDGKLALQNVRPGRAYWRDRGPFAGNHHRKRCSPCQSNPPAPASPVSQTSSQPQPQPFAASIYPNPSNSGAQ